MTEDMNLKKIEDVNAEIRLYRTVESKMPSYGKHAGDLVDYRATVAVIKKDDTYFKGKALCSPKDHFNKRVGRAMAIGRAVSALEKWKRYTPTEMEKRLFERKVNG